jgi:hypothetical protein
MARAIRKLVEIFVMNFSTLSFVLSDITCRMTHLPQYTDVTCSRQSKRKASK